MKLHSTISTLIIAAVLLIHGHALAQKRWPGVVLYNIEMNGVTKRHIVDPVVRISKGEFSYPLPIPPDTWDKADANKLLAGYFDRFNRQEYPKGRKLELFIDGNRCGQVKITELDTLNSCSPVVSEVEFITSDSTAHPFSGHGLVIGSLSSGKTVQKFPVDSVLEKTLYDYGKEEFIRRGVKQEIAGQMEIKSVRAIDIDEDGKPEYLVSYFIIGEEVKQGEIETNMQYSFNVILKPMTNGYKQLFLHFPEPAIPEQTHIYKYIDVLDLDGDGTCEIVIQQITSMTAWDYILLKKKGDVWVEVYEGAGSGC